MPKRVSFHGLPSHFDWEGEAAKIREANETQLARSSSGGSDFINLAKVSGTEVPGTEVSGTESDNSHYYDSYSTTPTLPSSAVKKSVKKEGKCKFDVGWLSTCYQCKVAVWVGPEDAVIAGVCIACPREADWEQMANQEPYCTACWKKETDFLASMSAAHKAKGGKKSPAKKTKGSVNKKSPAKKMKRPVNKKSPTKKKKGSVNKQKPPAKKTKASVNKQKPPAKKKKTPAKKRKAPVEESLEELKLKVVTAANDVAIQTAVQAAGVLPKSPTTKIIAKTTAYAPKKKKRLGGIPTHEKEQGVNPWEVCTMHKCILLYHHHTQHHTHPPHTLPGRELRKR